MAKPESANVTKRTAKWKEQEYPTVYSNMMGIGMTPFDVAIVFGEVADADEKTLFGSPKVKVLLTPEQALNLKNMLSAAVEKYIKVNGAIRTSGAVNVAELMDGIEGKTKPNQQ